MSNASASAKHPLAGFFPTDFRSFSEWLARWNDTTVLAERLGLLHCMQTMEYWLKEREQSACFLIDVANGWRNGKSFHHDWRDYGAQNINTGREIISRKAFDVLCVKLFAPGKENYPPSWWWMLEKQETFDKLLQFCSPEADNYNRPRKGQKGVSHQTEVFGEFMEQFCRLGWTYSRRSYEHEEFVGESEVRARLVTARPQFIEILHYLRQLSWLNRSMSDFSADFPELDEACLAKLKKIAFRADLPLPAQDVSEPNHSRKPKNLHEAIFGGSVAAEILVLHSIRQREQKRFNALLEESRNEWQELQRKQELLHLAKQQEALAKRAEQLTGKKG